MGTFTYGDCAGELALRIVSAILAAGRVPEERAAACSGSRSPPGRGAMHNLSLAAIYFPSAHVYLVSNSTRQRSPPEVAMMHNSADWIQAG
jgi:hypothetical protein